MASDPITAGIDLATTLVQKIWPDKSAEEQQQLAAVLSRVQGQMDINKAEAQSTDPLQHWRGGLGWVCVAGYAWDFVLQPLITTVSIAFNHPIIVQPLDIAQLSTLTLGMLGLGAMHVTQQIKGVR